MKKEDGLGNEETLRGSPLAEENEEEKIEGEVKDE